MDRAIRQTSTSGSFRWTSSIRKIFLTANTDRQENPADFNCWRFEIETTRYVGRENCVGECQTVSRQCVRTPENSGVLTHCRTGLAMRKEPSKMRKEPRNSTYVATLGSLRVLLGSLRVLLGSLRIAGPVWQCVRTPEFSGVLPRQRVTYRNARAAGPVWQCVRTPEMAHRN